ncbi:MAG: acyl carrier protein [Bacteroidales bacterium]|jgi:acyl carrier protein|nr:acyl carrier protein [Bacteroidales bacterium]
MELFNEVTSIINRNMTQSIEIKPQDRLRDDLNIDSFDTMMIGCELEDYFHITIDPDEIKNLKVVQDLVNMLEMKVSVYQTANV